LPRNGPKGVSAPQTALLQALEKLRLEQLLGLPFTAGESNPELNAQLSPWLMSLA
jgi:hypothetical protein